MGVIGDEGFDSPRRPTITSELIERIRAYYQQPGHGNGGALHILLEDQNIDRGHAEFCAEWARDHGDAEGEAIANILIRMSRTQRSRLAGMSFGREALWGS